MRRQRRRPVILALISALAAASAAPGAGRGETGAITDVEASAPQSLSVTLYRNPDRSTGSIRLSALGGFALVTEVRDVQLRIGETRIRFKGVVDGIESDSAIITGLPHGVVEKNRDAALLSPEALVKAALDSDVTLVRRQKKTGVLQIIAATIRSADPNGIVVQTPDGIEALKCSGLAETLQFDHVPSGLSAVPTLSVLARSDRAVTARVTLSYLTSGFDWAADYVATLDPDGRTLDLSAWMTLANGNSVALPQAAVQVVAGRLNRRQPVREVSPGRRVLARCWPEGTTSGSGAASPDPPILVTARSRHMEPYALDKTLRAVPAPAAPPPPPEALGDLKLYRLNRPITIAARQSKQVRLLHQTAVDYRRVMTADLPIQGETRSQPAIVLLRSTNARSHNLGLPLPAGRVLVFRPGPPSPLLVGDAPLADTAVDEKVELKLGRAPSVLVAQSRSSNAARQTVQIANGGPQPVSFELQLHANGRVHVVDPDHAMTMKDGRPLFRLEVPANTAATVHYTVAPG